MCCWLWPGYLCLSTSPQGLVCTYSHKQKSACLLVKAGSPGTFKCQEMLSSQALPASKIPEQGVTLHCIYTQLSDYFE